MTALKQLYEDLGLMNIQTYIQSGNVVFLANPSDRYDLGLAISRKIKENFGFEVPAFVLEMADLRDIIENNPYSKDQKKKMLHLHVTFLPSKYEVLDVALIDQRKLPGEEYTLAEKVIYLYCPNGYGKTKLNNTFFEKTLKVNATTRNWQTVTELLKIAEKQGSGS
jgi:uncharacterized protein (DUF1697 family)